MRCITQTARMPVVVLALLALLPQHASAAIPTMTRDEIIAIAKTGVGCPYVWGGTCWDPNNKSWKGADCSGYVTKCWQIPATSKTTDCLPHYYTTKTFYNATTHWTNISRSSLLKADALVYNNGSSGHIVLYYSGDKWGSAQVYEAKGTAYGIVYNTKNVSSSYMARRRNSIVNPITYPLLTITSAINSISGQTKDFCTTGTSQGIFDWNKGQKTTVDVDIKNSGTAVGQNVKVTLWAEEPYLAIRKWNIYTNWKSSSFVLNDADGLQSIAHDNPGKEFTLNLLGISSGETKRITLAVEATRFSIGAAEHPDIRAWVSHVDSYYDKTSFSATPNNVGSYQKQNNGDLKTYYQTDVFTAEVCDGKDNDCDGKTDEDNVCSSGTDGLSDGTEPEGDGGAAADTGTQQLSLAAEGGCGCRLGDVRRQAGSPFSAALLLLALLALRRRR